MGWKWEVSAWVRAGSSYTYEQVYAGNSFVGAVRAAHKAKRGGAGCIKVEWR